MATDSRAAHTYSRTVHTHTLISERLLCLSHAAVCFHLADITKAHYHCDTLAGSVMQTERQTDTVALTSQFRLCQQLFDPGRLHGRSRSRRNRVAVEAVE